MSHAVIDLHQPRQATAASAGFCLGVDVQIVGSVEVPTAEEAQWSTHSADRAPDLRRRATELQSADED